MIVGAQLGLFSRKLSAILERFGEPGHAFVAHATFFLQCDVTSESTTLPNGFGLVVTLTGGALQAWLGQRVGLRPRTSYWAAGLVLGFSLLIGSESCKSFAGACGLNDLRSWVDALLSLWFLCVIGGAVLLAVVFALRRWTGVSSKRRRKATVDTDKRQFLLASTAAACALPAAALGFGIITRKDFRINEIEIKLPDLPSDLHGLKLLQISDIHIGPFFTAKDVARVVDASNSLRPDIAFVTGDLITTKNDPLDQCIVKLARLRSGSGIWGCMGNHEHYAKVEGYTAARARELDIFFLRSQSQLLRFGSARLNLVGVDYQRQQPYLGSVADLVDLDSTNLLLAHTPEVFPEAAAKGFDLVLSGHTHGGQLNLQLMGTNLNVAELHTPYTKGLYTLPTSTIYVNSGLGTIGPPVRLGAPAEITLLRLCKG